MHASPRPETAIRAINVGRRYGRVWALDRLSFELSHGRALLVAGPNGSGKSTLLRLILGLESPDAGELTIFGRAPGSRSERPTVGVLLHDDAVYPQLTVSESVDLWRGVCASPRPTRELLALVGLEAAVDRPVAALSAGMRKRLALTRSLMIEPQLVVWDEPLASLDAEGRELVLRLIEKLKREAVSVVVAGHERDLFGPLMDDVLDLDTTTSGEGLQERRS